MNNLCQTLKKMEHTKYTIITKHYYAVIKLIKNLISLQSLLLQKCISILVKQVQKIKIYKIEFSYNIKLFYNTKTKYHKP